jgi:hypothetical protein
MPMAECIFQGVIQDVDANVEGVFSGDKEIRGRR